MFPLTIADALARTPRVNLRCSRTIANRTGEDAAPQLRQLHHQLANEGFELIGNGAYSIVLKHKDWPGRVLKISTRHGLEDEDGDVVYDAGVAYWQYCLENRGKKGKHLPVVYATGKLTFAGACVPYVWMKEYTKGNEIQRHRLAHDDYWREGAWREDQRRAHEYNNIDSNSWFTILQEASRMGYLDFHADNMMYDPELATFIITDPVY